MAGGRVRQVERIGTLINGALPERVRQGLTGWRAVELWPRVAGGGAARRSAAVAFREGRLTVDVANSVWMHQLSACKRGLLQALNDALGEAVVREITFRINPRVETARTDGARADAAAVAGSGGGPDR